MLLLKKTKPIRYEKKKLWEVVLIVYWLCGLLKYPYYKCDNWLFIKKKNNCKNKSTDVHIFPSFKVILIIDLHVSLHNLKITYLLV